MESHQYLLKESLVSVKGSLVAKHTLNFSFEIVSLFVHFENKTLDTPTPATSNQFLILEIIIIIKI